MKKPRKPKLDYPRTIAVLDVDILDKKEFNTVLEELNNQLSSVRFDIIPRGIHITAKASDINMKKHEAALEKYEQDLIEWKKFQLKKLQAEVEEGNR